MSRVCVFIDGSNFYHGCRENLGRTDVRLGQLAELLVSPRRFLVRTYYYNSAVPSDSGPEARLGQQKFISALQRTPYFEVRLSRVVRREEKCPNCGDTRRRYVEKGVDMHIGVDMLAGASKNLYDVAVLVTGDGDLVDAVRAVKDHGKHVELATFRFGRSDELASAADVVIELTPAMLGPLCIRASS
jgi:uncharacterized LabA/DUF88 family protein